MSFSYSDFAASLQAGATIGADDVLAVRRAVWPDGTVGADEAEAVFALNRAAAVSCPEWDAFLIEGITDYVVNQTAPRGYVTDAHAAWLIDQIERDGAAITATELALVVKVIETALNCPAALKSWALGQIEAAVLSGEGPTRAGPVRAGTIDECEVALLRRLVFAPGGEGALVVGKDEAEMLWRLKDATLGADNAPGWKTLFVQALGNHLMAYSSYTPLQREEAARLEAFVGDHSSSVLGFFARMSRTRPADAARAFSGGPARPDYDAAVAAANAVTPDEKSWLDAHIDADGARDALEEALLAFIAEESRN
jgi:hypothetical protein